MIKRWHDRRLEVITLFIFTSLVTTALIILYVSYDNYIQISDNTNKALMHQVIMFISSFILFISFLLVFLKRDYFFVRTQHNSEGLSNLFEEIKNASTPFEIDQFKKMLKDRNHTEIYTLISDMINELQENKKQADEANSSKSIFLSNVSHELRTPINGIVGFTKILSSTKLDSEQREFIGIIRKSSEDLLGIIENILDISKIDNGSIELEKSYFSMIDEFENLSDIYALDASKKNIDFSLWIDPSFSWLLVESDPEKIKQILMNLISNAIKFTKEEGSVNVSIEKVKQKEKSLEVKFSVNDTGIGISEEQQSKVFYAFTQGDNSSTRAYGGVGLGLTISNIWVKLLGGQLQLESFKGEGTTLSFILEFEQKDILIEDKVEALNVAIFRPESSAKRVSDKHLQNYLSFPKNRSLSYFKTFVECKDAKVDGIDILYLHYFKINKEELQRIVAQYSNNTHIVLVTKLDNRFQILDIAPIFSQIIYEPITYSKVKKSLEASSQKRKVFLAEQSENLFNLKALVVEDNKVNQNLIIHTLKCIGIESDSAEDGAMAVEMFKKNSYDIVFMDIQMPVMNGVIATKEILKYEKIEKLDHTPIVAVTTNTLDGDRERYLEVGMDEYIPKPIALQKFINVVKQFYGTELNDKVTQFSDPKFKRLLLYRENPTDAKIMRSMIYDLGYHVDIAKNRTDCSQILSKKRYDALLLDHTENNTLDRMLMDVIYNKKINTLLFVEKERQPLASDLNIYVYPINKFSNFIDIQDQLEKILSA